MKIVFVAKQYGGSTASCKTRILKQRRQTPFLQKEKISEAQTLSGLCLEYTCFISKYLNI